jgi:PPK2 family polyphosphate:nucleotide phosphotransferase
MFKPPDSPFLVPYDNSFRVADATTGCAEAECAETGCASADERLAAAARRLRDLQRVLTANNSWSVLLIFQGMDAAGKNGTIRAVLRETDPTAVEVSSFRKPTQLELDHDFLWRINQCLPKRGHIGVFNRSQYEEVLIVRVHRAILEGQQLPAPIDRSTVWDRRLQSIRNHERHLAHNGTVVLKFWLNVSPDEQRRRFLSRIDVAEKNWKFNPADIVERRHWAEYMRCYEVALNATSRPWAPWYAIPADDKPFMRAAVANIVADALDSLELRYPAPTAAELEQYAACREALVREGHPEGHQPIP